ncbi:MAG: biopolymer transport protein ExbB [Puniceicoccaceae bacterium 5H]|nr:MAG: biopolymer transport protein ExbB [Puniceicoccaceae bacterium 5H]
MALVEQLWALGQSGGWVMSALALLSVSLYTYGFWVLFGARACQIEGASGTEWPLWIAFPRTAPEGFTRNVLTCVLSGGGNQVPPVVRQRFAEVRSATVGTLEQKIRLLDTLIAAAPLLGLLGTVLGLLATFTGLSDAHGGNESLDDVARGIRLALVTTASGLVIALPGLYLSMSIRRHHQRFSLQLQQLECAVLASLEQLGAAPPLDTPPGGTSIYRFPGA